MSAANIVQRIVTGLSSGFVLAFHEIEPKKLAELVESLYPAKVVPLHELAERSRARKKTSGLLAITVDDGVGSNVRGLYDIFCRKQWPGTFYVSSQYLDTGEHMLFQWWRELVPLLPARRLVLKSGVVDLTCPGSLERLSRKMEVFWHSERLERYLPIIMELIDLVVQDYGIDREAIRPPAPIGWDEVALYSKNELIAFESHGVSHTALSALTEDELIFEFSHSQKRVEDHTGRPCRHFAYPFGNKRSIGDLAPRIARLFYDSAVTMDLGHVDEADPWQLPRIPLYPQNSTSIARLKVLVKCSKLRPQQRRIEWAPEILTARQKSSREGEQEKFPLANSSKEC